MKKIFLVFLAGGLLTGCAGFLDEQSQSEVIPKTASDFKELLMGSGYPDPGGKPNFSYTSLMEDDIQMVTINQERPAYAGSAAAIISAPIYQWQPSMADRDGFGDEINVNAGGTVYSGFYNRILGCNAVLDLVDGSIGTRAEKDRIKAEALAVRALYYFWLTNLYGKPYNSPGGPESPAVPLQLTSDLSDDSRERSTVGHIFAQVIIPDLLEALHLLEQFPVDLDEIRHIGTPAIHILLSRVYLYMDRYEDCIAEATKAIDMDIVLLDMNSDPRVILPSYDPSWNNYRFIDGYNPEVLWWYGAPGANGLTPYRPSGAIGEPGAEFRSLWGDISNQGAVADQRFKVFKLATNGWGDTPMTTKPYGSNSAGQAGMSIRTAEAYLNRAEAYALSDQTDKAYDDYNELRSKRKAGYTYESGLTGDDLVEAIRTERRRELCFEGHRWFDLRRYGMPEIKHYYKEALEGELLIYTLREGDEMYTLPFPRSVMENNRDTDDNKGLTQNPSAYEPARVPAPAAR